MFALQPDLRIELEVIFLSIRAYGIVDFELLIVFVHLEFAAGTSLGLDRSGELCAFVLGNLAIAERRQGEYRHRCNQPHEQVPPGVCSDRLALTNSRQAVGRNSTCNPNAGGLKTFRRSRELSAEIRSA